MLVIGGGLAGCTAALAAVKKNPKVRVVVVTKKDPASRWAQGGVVYAADATDSKLFEEDILKAGCGKNFVPAVQKLCDNGPSTFRRWCVQEWNVPFEKRGEGLDLHLEAAHSKARVAHVKDYSGDAIWSRAMANAKAHSNIQFVEGTLVDLLLSHLHDVDRQSAFSPSRVLGAYVLLSQSQKVEAIVAKSTVLATGGFSQLYLHATGPSGSLGDGISAAHRAGARTMHLEYVQFHPTALFVPGQPRRLITEAIRGAGARLLNLQHQEFVDPLERRDVVARAIHEELVRTGTEHVWLDAKNIAHFDREFPAVFDLCKQNGIDPSSECIPVVPAAHYTIGGVWTDLRGATSIPGLYAAGEVACTGLHGANRLASTALLEALVFGESAGEAAAEESQSYSSLGFVPKAWRHEKGDVDPALVAQDVAVLRQTLWNYVGLVRTEHRMQRAEGFLVELRNEVESFYKRAKLSEELVSLRHSVLVATLLLYSALRNRESVGTHFLK